MDYGKDCYFCSFFSLSYDSECQSALVVYTMYDEGTVSSVKRRFSFINPFVLGAKLLQKFSECSKEDEFMGCFLLLQKRRLEQNVHFL